MHADFHELSEMAAGRRQLTAHVRGCTGCRAELSRLGAVRDGLRSLAALPAPVTAWAGTLSTLERRSTPAAPGPAVYVMAATLVLMLVTAMLLVRQPAGVSGSAAEPAPRPPLDGLVAQNARLEAYLAGLPQLRTTRVGTAYTVAALEDRLAFVDDRITTVSLEPNAPEIAEELWRERVTLMNSLVQVHYANAVASR